MYQLVLRGPRPVAFVALHAWVRRVYGVGHIFIHSSYEAQRGNEQIFIVGLPADVPTNAHESALNGALADGEIVWWSRWTAPAQLTA